MAMRFAGILGELDVPLGLGLLRLTTEGRPTEDEAVAVIHFALDQGIRVLDTADVYGLDDSDLHFGERLAQRAVACWHGPRKEVRILTKVGLARPGGRWVPNGRPDHLRRAVDESLRALEVDRLFLLQLHVHDPRVPFEETLAALAELQRSGKVEHLGLCNTTPGEVHQAQRHFTVAAVQNELSVLQRKSAQNGLLTLALDQGIVFLAHRPLGGQAKVGKLARNRILVPLSQRHQTSPQEIALAALLDAGPHVVPLFGATGVESVRSSINAARLTLDVSDHTALGLGMSFAPDPEKLAAVNELFIKAPISAATGKKKKGSARSAPVPPAASPFHLPASAVARMRPCSGLAPTPEVVILMGIQGAGKSSLVDDYVERGYVRLNRDLLGGRLDDLVPRLHEVLTARHKLVVLDNTYPTRLSRAPVIAAARFHGLPTRCVHLQIPLVEAQVNVALRMIQRYGRPLGPEEMKACRKSDPNLPPPAALNVWLKSYEPPALDEGFSAVDTIPFVRRPNPGHQQKGLLLDVDGTLRRSRSGALYPCHPDDVELLPRRFETLLNWVARGYHLFFVSNQSGVAAGKLSRDMAEACFKRTAELLRLPVTEIAYCPHQAHPIACWCRKPMPALGVYLVERHRLARKHLIMVGDMASDAEFAAALGAKFYEAQKFF